MKGEGGNIMYCRHCGKELNDNDKICKYCMVAVDSEKVQNFKSTKQKRGTSLNLRGACGILIFVIVLVVGIVIMSDNSSTDTTDITNNSNNIDDADHSNNSSNNSNSSDSDNVDEYVEDNQNNENEIIEKNVNKNGNTYANLLNGGWVAEQGDWNYYALQGYLLKENVISGEKIILHDFGGDVEITSLRAMGDWLYYIHEKYGLCRTKIDGSEYAVFVMQHEDADTIRYKYNWEGYHGDLYDGNLYKIMSENITASTYEDYFAKINFEDGSYEYLVSGVDGLDLVGVEDNYAYFRQSKSYTFFKMSLEDYSVQQCSMDLSDNDYSSYLSDPYIVDGEIVVFAHKNYSGLSQMYYTNFDENKVLSSPLGEDFQGSYGVNFVDGYIIYRNSSGYYENNGSIMKMDNNGTVSCVVPDQPNKNTICVAHGKIYYRYGAGAYRVNLDGTGFEEINVNDFDYLYQ